MVVWAGEEEQEVWPLSLVQDWCVMINLHLIAEENVWSLERDKVIMNVHWIVGDVVVVEVWFLSLLQDWDVITLHLIAGEEVEVV